MNQTRGTRQVERSLCYAVLIFLYLCNSLIDLTLDSNPHRLDLNRAVVPFCRYVTKLGFGS